MIRPMCLSPTVAPCPTHLLPSQTLLPTQEATGRATSLDTSFLGIGAEANGEVSSIAVQSDGKILVGGWFTTYNGTARGYLARLLQ